MNSDLRNITGEELSDLIKSAGPGVALLKLREQYSASLSRRTLKILRRNRCSDPHSHMEDIVQQVWLAVYVDFQNYFKGLKSFSPSRPAGWLFTIAANQCNRHASKEEQLGLAAIEVEGLYNELNKNLQNYNFYGDSPETELYKREVAILTHKCVNQLSSESKVLLQLFLLGFTHQEIASLLEITSASSRKKLSRIIKQLRKMILTKEHLP